MLMSTLEVPTRDALSEGDAEMDPEPILTDPHSRAQLRRQFAEDCTALTARWQAKRQEWSAARARPNTSASANRPVHQLQYPHASSCGTGIPLHEIPDHGDQLGFGPPPGSFLNPELQSSSSELRDEDDFHPAPRRNARGRGRTRRHPRRTSGRGGPNSKHDWLQPILEQEGFKYH